MDEGGFLSMLEIRDLHARIGDKEILKGLTLTVKDGEVAAIMGPNGSGKSTLSYVVAGREGYEVTEGEVLLNGENILDMPPDERKRRSAALIKRVGLERDRKRQLREYSKGMTRRIGVAQALINDPELVILDEPTSGLDPIGTREMKDLIIELREKGKTVIMSSHLLADVEDVCDRIAVLHQGELKELGRVEDLLRVTDVTQIRAKGLSAKATEEIREVLRRHGGEDVEIGNPRTTLEDLFLDVVRDTEARPGRRARQGQE